LRVCASKDFQLITNPITVRIKKTLSFAIQVIFDRLSAGVVRRNGRVRVVIACIWICAAHAGIEVTRTVVDVGGRIVVAGERIGASGHSGNARSVVLGGIWVKIGRSRIRATAYFLFVTNSVVIRVKEAVAVAIDVVGLGEGASRVGRNGRVWVVIACGEVGAANT
jgi:hypothetical protein